MKKKNILTALALTAALTVQTSAFAADKGASVKVGDYAESAAETQKLIDNRPNIQRRMENLNRGIVAVKTENGVFVSWRWLGTESADTRYNLYKNGVKLNDTPLNATNYIDMEYTKSASYTVTAVVNGVEGSQSEAAEVLLNNYIEIPIQKPQNSKIRTDNGTEYEMNLPYTPGDASVADLDGDGEYEVILKWDPSWVRDASKAGYTGDCVIDAYKMDGTLMWRVNLGQNIRSGAHDTQFIVYDFDNDGMAEMACRTADGTIAGDGSVIGDADKDWAALDNGKNLKGPLYLTVFNGKDGSVMDTVPYDPQTIGDGYDLTDWGDSWGNRSERYLAGLGCVDGVHTSFQMARGYYGGPEGPLGGRTVIASYHVEDKKIVKDWIFDTKENNNWYIGQGNHSMSMADIDYDGLDEVIFGALTVDHDGTAMYCTNLGHGDSQHVGDILPSRPGLEIYSAHESVGADYGYELRDARTGEILVGEKTENDNGRACTADIDPNYEGEECWSLYGTLTSADGTVISNNISMPINYAIYWDADLGRELQDENTISKWNVATEQADTIFSADGCRSINSGKATPALTADIFGDWREETIYPTEDGDALRIFTTTDYTSYKIPTLMHDTQYRNHVALQNVCYNQPTHLSYYLGYDTKTIPVPQMYTVDNGIEVRNPDLAKKSWSIDELYSGNTTELVINSDTALVNNKVTALDTAPYINEESRTMVPLRFIAEAFGADVEYDDTSKDISITLGDTSVKMNVNSEEFTVNGAKQKMDTKPVISNDRTMVPIRFAAEAINKNVNYYNDGLVVVSDSEAVSDKPAERVKYIKNAKVSELKVNAWAGRAEPQTVTATVDEDNAKNANDGDFTTVWHAQKDASITADLGRMGVISAAGISFADNKPHKIRLECSNDGENWTLLKDNITVVGEPGEELKCIIGITKYNNMLRLTCLDEDGFDLSEFAVLEVR